MKRFGNLMPKIASLQNVILAYAKASTGKKRTVAVQAYEARLDVHLALLVQSLNDGSWLPSDYSRFVVHDPKRRVIHAAPFSDRVAHHALLNVAGPCFESSAIDNSFACRKGRGNLAAVDSALRFTRRHGYFLKLDIRRYFDSIDHLTLCELFRWRYKDGRLLKILNCIVDSYHTRPGTGIPIGTLTSQYFANFYLDAFDHWVQEFLKCRAYVRYMDDFVLWHDDPNLLSEWLVRIQSWLLEIRGLVLRNEPAVTSSKSGVSFLGYRIVPAGIMLGAKARRRFVSRLIRNENEFLEGKVSSLTLQRKTDALLAFTNIARCIRWRRKIAATDRISQSS